MPSWELHRKWAAEFGIPESISTKLDALIDLGKHDRWRRLDELLISLDWILAEYGELGLKAVILHHCLDRIQSRIPAIRTGGQVYQLHLGILSEFCGMNLWRPIRFGPVKVFVDEVRMDPYWGPKYASLRQIQSQLYEFLVLNFTRIFQDLGGSPQVLREYRDWYRSRAQAGFGF